MAMTAPKTDRRDEQGIFIGCGGVLCASKSGTGGWDNFCVNRWDGSIFWIIARRLEVSVFEVRVIHSSLTLY
jgi:hypothetical protein